MSLDIDVSANKMERLFNDIVIEERIISLRNLKTDLFNKKRIIDELIVNLKKVHFGKNTQKLINQLRYIETDLNNLYENFDDRLMIFIIGSGKVGKSTLLNALIGYKVAEINNLPNTWKIDIYSPELQNNKALIKYYDGKKEELLIEKVKAIVNNEEKKSKESKKLYNDKKNKALKELKTKEEREEMKKYLAEQYLYKSNVSEVRWPVDKNWILEKCLLVDTPGLNQNLNDLIQLGDIHDYYHKADGVLWILDGQTIAAESDNNIFEELNNELQVVGGVRNNIVGVINRMDLVKKDGGSVAVLKVETDAKKYLGNKFSKLVGISAQQAFEGIKNNKLKLIEDSGILTLQNAIRDIFISKSESVKNSAKIQGNNKLLEITNKGLQEFNCKVEHYENVYVEKKQKLSFLNEKLKGSLSLDVENFFVNYLSEVKSRVEINIDALAQGNGLNFIKDNMYKLDEFILSRNKFLENKMLEVKNNSDTWEKLSKISEYKYINKNPLLKESKDLVDIDLNFNSLNNIGYFTPSVGENLFSFLGNVFGKAMFWLKKNGIKSQINDAVFQQCNIIKDDITNYLNNNVDKSVIYCKAIMDATFSDILFEFKNVNMVKENIKSTQSKINEKSEYIQLKNIIL